MVHLTFALKAYHKLRAMILARFHMINYLREDGSGPLSS